MPFELIGGPRDGEVVKVLDDVVYPGMRVKIPLPSRNLIRLKHDDHVEPLRIAEYRYERRFGTGGVAYFERVR